MPEISVIIPAYNAEKHLARCLDSVIGQTFRDLEIIVVDDGSTDGTQDILEGYAEKDSRIIVVKHKVNSGIFCTRITGIEASAGRYLTFVDSDDELIPDACSRLYSEAVRTGADQVIADHDSIGADGSVVPMTNRLNYGDSSFGLAMAMARNEVFFYTWSRLFKRELFTDPQVARQDNISMGEDIVFNFHAARFVKKVVLIHDRLYRYYQNPYSITHGYPTDKELVSEINARKLSIGFGGEIDPRIKEALETSLVRKFHVWIKKGVGSGKVMDLARSFGLDYLLSFGSLCGHLGTRKGISYYLATHTGIYPWLLYGRKWKE